MKVKKVIVDEMPEMCEFCPMYGFYEGDIYSGDYECGKQWYSKELKKHTGVPDHRCLCEVEGEGE